VDATPYTYLFIRTDLSPAQQIVQASHAALEAGNRFGPHSHLVLIGTEGEDELLKAAAQLGEHGIDLQTFYEPDNNAGYTAFCTQPLQGDKRKPLRKYQLYRAMATVA
jgi:hypothetical protein